jgi:thiol-disulfide isomerase/thioredoxin
MTMSAKKTAAKTISRRKAVVSWTGAFLAIAALALSGCAKAPEEPKEVVVGGLLPSFELPNLEGQPFQSASLKGQKPVIVNFWATWCGPCRLEMPALQELHRGGGAQIVSIAIDDGGAADVLPFVQKEGLDYPVLIGDNATLERYGGVALPYTLVLDGDLRVHSIHRAMVSQRTLETDLAAAGG